MATSQILAESLCPTLHGFHIFAKALYFLNLCCPQELMVTLSLGKKNFNDLRVNLKHCFSIFQNAYSYSQWYQQYGAAYGHPHQTATQ